ncbi:hypothetical protein MTO96_017892 [Rhipicephalus appendiculatus]|uniref:Uncharacterized protein n=1 Tax=Rhipicephalus appendiculatus TaxID=34631 RepID=A0A131YBJ8_RHIAP
MSPVADDRNCEKANEPQHSCNEHSACLPKSSLVHSDSSNHQQFTHHNSSQLVHVPCVVEHTGHPTWEKAFKEFIFRPQHITSNTASKNGASTAFCSLFPRALVSALWKDP